MCAVLQHEVQLELPLELTAARQQDSWWESARHELPAAADSSTRWRVLFVHYPDDDMRIHLECTFLDEQQFGAAAVRVFAAVHSDPSNWADWAHVVPRGESCCGGRFAKPLREWGAASRTAVRVRVRWTDVVRLLHAPSVWSSGRPLRVHCRWRLPGSSIIQPTARVWWLYSEPFDCGGSVWRMRLINRRKRDGSRRLQCWVFLDYLPAVVDAAGLRWRCTLAVNDTLRGEERREDMKEGLGCIWFLFNPFDATTCEQLELTADIIISRIP